MNQIIDDSDHKYIYIYIHIQGFGENMNIMETEMKTIIRKSQMEILELKNTKYAIKLHTTAE